MIRGETAKKRFDKIKEILGVFYKGSFNEKAEGKQGLKLVGRGRNFSIRKAMTCGNQYSIGGLERKDKRKHSSRISHAIISAHDHAHPFFKKISIEPKEINVGKMLLRIWIEQRSWIIRHDFF